MLPPRTLLTRSHIMNATRKPFAYFSDGTPVPLDGQFHVDPLDLSKSVRCLESWTPPGVSTIISGGNTAHVGLLPDGSVLKFPIDRLDSFSNKALAIEHCILSHLGEHNRIVPYLGREEHGLRFQRAAKGDVRRRIHAIEPHIISLQLRIKWSIQAAEALAFIHSRGVIHCDIHPNNFLLDEALNLQLCDFSGSLFGNLDGTGMESIRFFLPRDPLATPTKRSDLFALGSAIYFIISGCEPYNTLTENEVTARYTRGDFPAIDSIPCGRVIMSCWKGDLKDANEVCQALLEERKALVLL